MRWLIALIAALAAASGARAQTQASIVCPHYDREWAAASPGGNLATLQRLAAAIPAFCPVKAQAEHRVAALQAQYAAQQRQHAAEQRAQAKPAETTEADSKGDDAGDEGPTPYAAAAPPTPLVACSVAAVEAQFPQIPDPGSDPGSRSGSHADLAASYVHRAAAFHACQRDDQAVGDLNDAMRLDPHSFTAADAAGDLALSAQDYDTAITNYSAAIALETYLPQDRNGLTAYAGRAAAEAALARYPDEIRDLEMVTQHYNDAAHEELRPLSVYHEALAKALYRSGQADAAASELTDSVDVADRDAEDLQFLGKRRLQARDWAGAIALLRSALVKLPDDLAARPGKARIEVLLAQAFAGSGDQPEALRHFKLAADYDPGNADAAAGHANIGDPPPPPTFEDPTLSPVDLPEGVESVAELASFAPPPFCDQAEKNLFLNSVSRANDVVNANITLIARVSDVLLKRRAVYDADPRLDYNTKVDDEAMFDRELQKLRDESSAFFAEGTVLNQFFHRINDDQTDFKVCRPANSAAGRG